MNAEGNLGLGAPPTDLILQIFLRLPSETIARCRCVSKLWASILRSPDFTELFLTQSTTRPRLLFTLRRNSHDWCLYSCPQPQISDKNPESSLSVTAEFHMSLPETWIFEMSSPISGLIYFPNMPFYNTPILCNPSTRHIFRIPQLTRAVRSYCGYDPIDKQFSVLAISHRLPSNQDLPSSYQILKLGSGRLSWRNIECALHHDPLPSNTCINGILYYSARAPNKIASFDLNSEEYKFLDGPWPHQPHLLVNFKGKLSGIKLKWIDFGKKNSKLELRLWVLEDVEKQEWSKHVYYLPSSLWNRKCKPYRILGVTGKGDMVLTLRFPTNPFYVYFFKFVENTLQKVEIKGFGELFDRHIVRGCVDYVEELRDLKWS